MGKTHPNQFEIMVDYMERNGDLQLFQFQPPAGIQERLDNLKKWNELVELLNNCPKGDPKPIEKWRKAWSDLKNNTKRKVENISKRGGEGAPVTEIEKRVLRLIGFKRKNRDITLSEENGLPFKVELDSDPCRGSLSPPQRYFASVDDHASRRRRKSSSASSSNSSEPIENLRKRRKSDVTIDGVKDITDRFFEYEKEKEKMAHEQEMARIKQNDQFLSILGRMVNVLETIAPSLQRYLDRNSNGDG